MGDAAVVLSLHKGVDFVDWPLVLDQKRGRLFVVCVVRWWIVEVVMMVGNDEFDTTDLLTVSRMTLL